MRITFAPQAVFDAEAAERHQAKIERRNAKTRAIILDNLRMKRHRCPAKESV